jgi:succinoglycan biosynthesis transport protein ExoP
MIRSSVAACKTSNGEGPLQSLVFKTVPVIPLRQEIDLKDETREQTTRLVRQLFFSGARVPQVVVFSGVERGTGCTWVCARSADLLSQHCDGPVCAVDADFRSPSLHGHFELDLPGETNKGTSSSNLWLLSPALEGPEIHSPQSFERLRSRISELRGTFTHILIDGPPINTDSDVVLLSEVADGLVMILEANDTRREAALKAKESLNAAGVPLLGAVLNKRTFPIPEKLYKRL